MDEQVEMMLRGSQFKHLLENELGDMRRKYGLKRSEVEILYYLSKCGENNTATDIRNHLKMTKGHISQVTYILCKKKYLSAYPDPEDHRYIHYVPTKLAADVISDVTGAQEKMYSRIFEGVTGEQLTVFKEIADKISCNMERLMNGG
ncbi:MAG: MarR family winged helix-turn-helix transcriptional regulator [Clostridiales bacterium]|nr:MarR family winged helix-turn-helix transcriptional regulator [Clostridiales bacterium]